MSSKVFSEGESIPGRFAFCVLDEATHVSLGENVNKHLTWTDVPDGTESLVVICHDPDVPTKPDDVNQEGREVPPDLPRTDFFHWVAIDLPSDLREIAEGTFAAGVVARGQQVADGPHGSRQGVNDYTVRFNGDADMDGTYYGYDGPCPPWNDSLVHHYSFTVYALDVARCGVEGDFTGSDVLSAIEGHVLASAKLIGTYTLNPRLV